MIKEQLNHKYDCIVHTIFALAGTAASCEGVCLTVILSGPEATANL